MNRKTINQIYKRLKKKYNKKHSKSSRAVLLEGRPQKAGICLLQTTKDPKKPNSGTRHVAKVKIKMFKNKPVDFKKNKEYLTRTCWLVLSGQSPNLTVYSKVLLQGGKAKDIIGIRYRGIRGNRNFEGVKGRKTSRSKYGTKRNQQ